MQSHIFIGYRGTGKTTVAQKLAARFALSVFDSDAEVERLSGKTIAAIFEQDGEPAFRDFEESVIVNILANPSPLVLSTGGGAILRSTTRNLLRHSGKVVWLTASPETILRRISNDAATQTMRPSLTALPMYEEIVAVLEQRQTLYSATAHTVIDTDCMTADDIVERLIEAMGVAEEFRARHAENCQTF